jgi:hypothetical protein
VIRLLQYRSLIATGALLSLLIPSTANAQTPLRQTRTPVLVELFTSEGCSSCPPADALLAKLDHDQPIHDADIIILEEHVDYWDQDGWHDRFSSHQYTDRQSEYEARLNVSNGSYTPQMIVDGTDQFVGNDAAHAIRAITHATQATKLDLTLTNIAIDGHRISAAVSAPATPLKGDLYAALVDPLDTTEVRSGENGGHRLQHAGVVRSMQRIGSLKDLTAGPHPFTLNAPSDANPGSMRIVVFAQRSGLGPILGVVQTHNPLGHIQTESRASLEHLE